MFPSKQNSQPSTGFPVILKRQVQWKTARISAEWWMEGLAWNIVRWAEWEVWEVRPSFDQT